MRAAAWLLISLQLIITETIRRMDLEVNCTRCQKQFTDNNLPRLFTACGHTFCEKCMNQLAVQIEQGKVSLGCPDCPQGRSTVVLEKVAQLPKNVALFNILESRKNNTSTPSINSLKDESFNVPKLNQSYHAEEEDEALMTAINGKQMHSEADLGERKKERVLTTPVLSHRISEGDEVCLLHNKQVQVVCLDDKQRLCSKCALFGQHKGHEVVGLDQVQKVNKQIYENLLEVFDEKTNILDQLTSKKRKGEMIDLITNKTKSIKKQISDKFKKIQDELVKTEKAIYHRLQQMSQNVQRKMKKLLDIDEKTINIYKSWATAVQDKFNSYQSNSLWGQLEFYLSGKGLIESGKDIIMQLKHQQSKSTQQAKRFVDELGVFFNDGPCLNSLHKIVQLYENQRQLQKKLGSVFAEKQNSKIFANVQFSYEDIKHRVKTEAHQDDESLLELVDEFDQNNAHSVISMKILNESMIRLQKATPSKTSRPSITGTPTSKPIPKKRPYGTQKQLATNKQIHKQQKQKQEKKEVMPREAIKKKMRAIKMPQKYEKMMEGVLTDSVQTVDFTNAELGDAISLQICELMKSNTRSRNLKLIRNKITDEGFAKLIPLLTAFSSINLSQNLLTQNSLNVLADLRPSLPNLKNVILSQNKIAERKCKALVERLKKMDLAISI